MIRKFLCILLLGLMLPMPVYAAMVTATGEGGDERSALHAAMREAVEQEVGVYIDSRTRIENYRLLSDTVYTKSEGYISHYEILKHEVIGGVHRTTIRADVSTELLQSRALSKIQKKAIVQANLEDPRIGVLAIDENDKTYPALENALAASLSNQGFSRIIDLSVADAGRQRALIAALSGGDRNAVTALRANATCDYLALVRIARDTKSLDSILPGLHKIYLTASARLVNTSTGEITWAGNVNAESDGWYGNSEGEAIQNAAASLAPKLGQAALGEAENVEQHTRITAPLTRFGTTDNARATLSDIAGVQHVFIRSLTAGVLTIDLDYDGTAADLSAELERSGYTIKALSSESITLQ